MASISGHAILSIVKGVAKTPGDSFSAEVGLDSIDLLDVNGFACSEYDIKIPALKSSAVYADSPLTDGRTLISGTLGNVTETIRLELTAGEMIQMAAMLSKLLRFKQDCNDYWDTFGQIEPIYIKHQVIGEPGPRYSLLYDIDIDVDTPLIPSEAKRTVTLVIEREYRWRGIAPGDNPKKWTAYVRNIPFNSSYADLSNQTNTDHLATATIRNFQELTTFNTFLTTNYLTIPASAIPGDLPALALIQVGSVGSVASVYLSRDTKPLNLNDTVNGVSQLRKLDIIAAGGTLGTNAAFVTDVSGGLRKVSTSVNQRRVDVSYGTASDVLRWSFQTDMTLMRGQFLVFARIRQYAGAQNDLRYYIKIRSTNDTFFTSDTSKAPFLSGTVAGQAVNPLDYLGVVTIPGADRSVSQMRGGNGLLVSDEAASSGSRENFVIFELFSSRVVGVAALLAFYDLILVPMDEGVVKADSFNRAGFAIFDNTGYLSHGSTDEVVQRRGYGSATDQIDNIEYAGQSLTLKPGADNYIYMLKFTNAGTPITSSTSASDFRIDVDIVPCWSGLRDK
jgi:hypothetical protein